MEIGTRISIPDTELEGTIVDVRGFYTPVSSPQKVPECPSAPKKEQRIKSQTGMYSPRRLDF